MKYEDLLELLKIGEGYTIEYKEKLSDSIAKDICAFANSSGGKIILGVCDRTGKITGFNLSNETRSKIQNYARNIEPSLVVNMEQVDDLAIIYVPEGKEKPYFSNGRCYLRQGANSQQLTRDEIRDFFQKTNLIRFDRKLNTYFDIDNDFDHEAFERFIEDSEIDKKLGKDHILRNLNLLENGKLTNAGVLFFAKSIRRFFMNSVITCVLYQGYERIDILDRSDFEDDFVSNLEGIIKFLMRNLRVKSVIKGLKRYDIPELEREVLREIVLNAMVHRDYWNEGRVLVEIFKDRIEISNPGGLLFDKRFLGKLSVTRNPILADLVHRIGLVERIGSGINRVKKALGERVDFEDEGNWFRVVIKREINKNTQEFIPETALRISELIEKNPNISRNELLKLLSQRVGSKLVEKVGSKLVENQIKIILLIAEKPNISKKELSKLIKISTTAIDKNIQKLKKLNIIKRRGADRGGHWEIVGQ